MKKRLFWAFLAALMLVLAASTALAAVTEVCPVCEVYQLTWSPFSDTEHNRLCGRCARQDIEAHTFSNGICTKCDYKYCGHENNDVASMPWQDDRGLAHMKWCGDCGYPLDSGWHTGGTATCSQKAVCEVCNHEYGSLSTINHAGTIEWNEDASDHLQHSGTCSACGKTVSENHYGGTALCNKPAFCSVCGIPYGEKDLDNHSLASYYYKYNAEQHKIKCARSGCQYYIYENHSDSDGNGQCELCNTWYNCPHPENKMGEWTKESETQHSRSCQQCNDYTETKNHTGGTATCTHGAVCDVCNQEYGTVNSDNHTLAAGGTYVSSWQHNVTCSECNKEVREDHYGGTATCTQKAVCTVCGSAYGSTDFNNHTYTGNWEYASNGKHKRPCGCQYTEETESCVDTNGDDKCDKCGHMDCDHPADKLGYRYYSDLSHESYCTQCNWGFDYTTQHSGGTATCTQRTVCDFCNHEYGSLSSTNHVGTIEWNDKDPLQHRGTCSACGQTVSERHYGGTDTCTQRAVCDACNHEYGNGNPNNHTNYTEWSYTHDLEHTRGCSACSGYESDDCYDRNGDGRCDACGHVYCQHTNLSEWIRVSDTQHRRYCDLNCDISYIETGDHTGGTATCTQKAVCDVCNKEYGSVNERNHVAFGPWTYVANQVHKHTCECGETKYGTCSDSNSDGQCDACENWMNCPHPADKLSSWEWISNEQHGRTCTQCNNYTEYGDCTDADNDSKCDLCGHGEKKECTHWYGVWTPNGNGTHTAQCKRYGCDYERTVDCSVCETTVTMGDVQRVFTYCPVCCDYGDMVCETITNTVVQALDRGELPRGELIVTGIPAPFEGALYAFTVNFELAGQVQPINCLVSITMPLEMEGEFKLVRVDEEGWTELEYTYEDGLLTFETEVGGMFLLVPVTEEPVEANA